MEQELSAILKTYGLLDTEVKVFLATLTLGEGSAAEIAKSASLNRVTTYEILKRLKIRGFVDTRLKPNNSTQIFFPEELETIKSKINARASELSSVSEDLDSLARWYKSRLDFASMGPKVQFVEGREGLKYALLKTLDDKPKEILSISAMDRLFDSLDLKFLQSYWDLRVTLKIGTRGIIPDSEGNKQHFNQEKNLSELRKIKFADETEMSGFENHVDISDTRVILFSLEKGKEHAVLIESEHVAKSWKALFEMLWSRI